MSWGFPDPPEIPRGIGVALAGAAGALAARLALRDRSISSVIVSIASGSLTAYYCAPAVAHWLKLSDGDIGALGFLCGVCGMYAIPAVIDIARDPIGAWRRVTAGPSLPPPSSQSPKPGPRKPPPDHIRRSDR